MLKRTCIVLIPLLVVLLRPLSLSADARHELCTVQELALQRDEAVVRGLRWLEDFMDKPENMLGMSEKLNSFRVFREFALTSADPHIRELARKAVNKFAGRLQDFFLHVKNPESDHQLLIDMLELAADRAMVDLDLGPLIRRAESIFSAYTDNEELYGVSPSDLDALTETEIYDLLMDAYAFEKADLEFPGTFTPDFRLVDVLRYLKTRRFVSFGEDTDPLKGLAFDHAYLATHVCYVLNNYGQLRLDEEDAPWLHAYMRGNFDYVMALKDLELVGEFVDVFRSLGCTEENDPMVRRGTEFLLSIQNPDGSWGVFDERDGPYRSMHYTWCAVVGLRNRTFLRGTGYHRRIEAILDRINGE